MGILWPHSNSIAFSNAGARVPGAKAYFFQAGTTTPRSTYQDAALTTPHTHPVLADGHGRFPAVFLDFGSYRERVRTAGDVAMWDTDNIPNEAPTDPAEGVDANSILQTGDVFFSFRQGTRDGCVRANGRSIGSATSGATERANADCQDLFTYLWNNFSNTICAVSGGRGANAAADWSANKTIALLDLRGGVPAGLADMGNSDAGHFNPSYIPAIVGNGTTGGSTVGANSHQLLLAQTPAHAHSISLTSGPGSAHTHGTGSIGTNNPGDHSHTINITDPGHGHTVNNGTSQLAVIAGPQQVSGSGLLANATTITINNNTTGITAAAVANGGHTHALTGSLDNESAHAHSVSGNTGSQGGNDHHNNMPRAVIGTFYIKL